MIKSFNKYNESIRDLMKPKSEEDIRKLLKVSDLSPYDKMYKAINNDLLWLAKEVLDDGFDLEKKSSGGMNYGTTFIHDSIDSNSVDILKLLLDKGYKIDVIDYYLGQSIYSGHLEMAKFLVSQGATISSDDEPEGNYNYLEKAINSNNLEMVKLVLDCGGIDCLVDNDWFEKILHHKSTNPEIIKLLIRKKSEIKDFVEKTYKKYEDGIKILSKYL